MTEPVYDLALSPAAGDGRLTEDDLRGVLCRLPEGSQVRIVVSDCEWYDAGVPGALARWLYGCRVDHHFAASAWRVARLWVAAYDAAAAQYAAVELHRLASG